LFQTGPKRIHILLLDSSANAQDDVILFNDKALDSAAHNRFAFELNLFLVVPDPASEAPDFARADQALRPYVMQLLFRRGKANDLPALLGRNPRVGRLLACSPAACLWALILPLGLSEARPPKNFSVAQHESAFPGR